MPQFFAVRACREPLDFSTPRLKNKELWPETQAPESPAGKPGTKWRNRHAKVWNRLAGTTRRVCRSRGSGIDLDLGRHLDPNLRAKWAGAKCEDLQGVFKQALILTPVPLTPEQAAEGIVNVVTIQIGGGRTADQMVEAARNKDCTYINPDITQKHMPSGYGKLRSVTLEFRLFDHEATLEEVCDWIEQPGHGHPIYEDGLRYREAEPEAQRERPHIFIPENPWCDALGFPCALNLWSGGGDRKVGLFRCRPAGRWDQDCLFARRTSLYLPTPFLLAGFGFIWLWICLSQPPNIFPISTKGSESI